MNSFSTNDNKWGKNRDNNTERNATIAHENDHWNAWAAVEAYIEMLNSREGEFLFFCKTRAQEMQMRSLNGLLKILSNVQMKRIDCLTLLIKIFKRCESMLQPKITDLMRQEVLMVTNRFMLSAFLLIIPLFSFSTTGESNVVVLLKSDVYIPPVRGDPGRVTPLMALIELSGGEVTNNVLDAHGRYQFAKAIGPFKYIDVRMNRDVKHLLTFYEPFKDGGMATQVVSRVTCYEPTFETAAKKVKDVKSALAREARIYSFEESGKPNVDLGFKTASPTFGGWIVVVSVRCVSANTYEYSLILERNFKNIGREMPEVSVEVDL